MNAICFKCGASKKSVKATCDKCNFTPIGLDDIAKSFILSKSFEVNGKTIGKSESDLKNISAQIQAGREYNFDENELKYVKTQTKQFIDTTSSKLVIDAARWLLPPIIILGIVFWLLSI
jgi:hypothetical protein